MGADTAVGKTEILGEPLLTGIAIILLPRVAEQHGEGHLIAGAELRRFQDEIGDHSEPLCGRRVGVLEDDVALCLFEDIADVSPAAVFHALIIARLWSWF